MTLLAKPEVGRVYTATELLEFPSDWHYELIAGRLREMAPTGDMHGRYTFDITLEIGWYVRTHGLGCCYAAETGFLIAHDPDTVKAPDFAFVAQGRLTGQLRGFVPLAPDLVVETRSPSDRITSVRMKIREWLDAGVRMAIDLDPTAQTLTVHRPGEEPRTLGADDTLEGGDVLPGFALPLARLFAP